MRGTMKAGVLFSLMLLFALAGSIPAAAGAPALPNTGINTDCPFPVSVDPICGMQITVYGSKPVNFYGGTRMPASWLPANIVETPVGSGNWTITFGNNPPATCIARNDPRWWECGVFKGVHFGFYSNDPIVNLLNPNSSVWSDFGPPCVYFGAHGETIPCTGLTSHAAHGFGQIAILNATASAGASAAASMGRVKAGGGQSLRISNVRIAVAPAAVPINNLGPCDLRDLAWQNVALANSVLPPSTPEGGVGSLDVTIPDNILGQKGWAVMTYDVIDPVTGNVLTRSTLDFPLNN
jgi:hypothetical protein